MIAGIGYFEYKKQLLVGATLKAALDLAEL